MEPNQKEKDSAMALSEKDALPFLQANAVTGGHRLSWGSNYTFLVRIDVEPGKYLRAIYKPRDGERPLLDFPNGTLYKREYLAFLLSRSLGWPNVPLTLIRDGPLGTGSMQLYVEHDPSVTYFNIVADRADELQSFAVFDLLVNNADRKAGHFLVGEDSRIWSIDHGLTFHRTFKMRTVMLEFWGEPISKTLLDDLESLLSRLESDIGLSTQFAELLSGCETNALRKRLCTILDTRRLPVLDPYRNVPWPWV